MTPPNPALPSVPRLKIGQLSIHQLSFDDAVRAIGALVDSHQGGYVFTPNVDHVVLAEDNLAFREAYAGASISVVDGMPIVWASRLLDVPLAERISGVDLILPLMKLGAERRWRVYLLGAGPGTAEAAARVIRGKYPVDIVGIESPMISIQAGAEQNDPIVRRIREAKPDLMLVALGSPKQEIWIHQVAEQLRPTVAIGIGAGLDFISGRVPRAPRWMSKSGLEWFYRLTQEPKRLWRRYLVNDPRFAGIFLRTLREQRGK